MSDDEDEYIYSDDEQNGDEREPSPVKAKKADAASAAAAAARPSGPAAIVRGTYAVGQDYRLLHEDELRAEQALVVREVASLLEIPEECADTLLLHFKWNKERLLDRYYADPKAVRAEAGIATLGVSCVAKGPFTCEICLDDRSAGEGFGLGCNHVFCKTCWANYTAAAVLDQGQGCVYTKCPATGCGEAVTNAVVFAMAAPEVAARWAQFETKHFVTTAKNMALCPGASCSNAFVCRAPVRNARCSCGVRFCFRCSREAHEPVTCDMLELWLEKCGNESETLNWIVANTKKCPKCAVRIEKNQGCNHIKCKSKGCLHEFCWTCLRPWTEHGQSTGGYYNCNKFKKGGATALTGTAGPTAGGDGSSAKAELERYLFYYARYDNHEKAGKFAAKNRIATQNRMAELQTTAGSSWSDVSFLEAAGEALLECRRVLKYTYVWGYYMPDGKERELFEHLQEQMERSTEHLAELTEAPLEKMARTDVANFTRVTLAFMRNLLEGIAEGLTGGEGGESAGGGGGGTAGAPPGSAGSATRPVAAAAAPAPKVTAGGKK